MISFNHMHFMLIACVSCSDNADETFRRMSELDPFQVAELCEQANTVAIHFSKLAEDLQTSPLPSLAVIKTTSDDAADEIKCPPLPRSTEAMALPTDAKAKKPSLVNPSRSQTKPSKEVPVARRSLMSATKENRAPAAAAAPSKPLTATSKACDRFQNLYFFLFYNSSPSPSSFFWWGSFMVINYI